MVIFISPERAKDLVREEPVVFAEIMGETESERSLEVHVMRRTADGLYEVERDDTGLVPDAAVRERVARIAAAHGSRYATIYRAEDRWPPPWASLPASQRRTSS